MYQVQTINTYSWYNKLSNYKAYRLKKTKVPGNSIINCHYFEKWHIPIDQPLHE